MSEIRARHLVIRTQRADITVMPVDAIVNSSNNRLWMGGGVGGAIKQAGGREVQDAAIQKAPIAVGEAVVTPGGKLPARYVIHAATTGPGFLATPETVRLAVRNSLRRARELGLASLAFPAMGAGMGRLKSAEAATIIIEEVLAYGRKASALKEVLIVLWDEATLRAFDAQMRRHTTGAPAR